MGNKNIESGNHMKKITSALLATVLIFTLTSCSTAPAKETNRYITNDELETVEGGTAGMTVFKSDVYNVYALIDGNRQWEPVSGLEKEEDLTEGSFIHVDAKYDLLYGGISGYKGLKSVTGISNRKDLDPKDVIAQELILPYNSHSIMKDDIRLIDKEGQDFILTCDSKPAYRLFDDNGEFLYKTEDKDALTNFIENYAAQSASGST